MVTAETAVVLVRAEVRPFGAALAQLPGTPVAASASAVVEDPP